MQKIFLEVQRVGKALVAKYWDLMDIWDIVAKDSIILYVLKFIQRCNQIIELKLKQNKPEQIKQIGNSSKLIIINQ